MKWLNEVVREHWKWCVNIFKMNATTLRKPLLWLRNMIWVEILEKDEFY